MSFLGCLFLARPLRPLAFRAFGLFFVAIISTIPVKEAGGQQLLKHRSRERCDTIHQHASYNAHTPILTPPFLGQARDPSWLTCPPRLAWGHLATPNLSITPAVLSADHSQQEGGAPCDSTTTSPFEPMSKRRRGFPSETHVKMGVQTVHGSKELIEKLGRNDLCPCGSGKRVKKCCLKSGCF